MTLPRFSSHHFLSLLLFTINISFSLLSFTASACNSTLPSDSTPHYSQNYAPAPSNPNRSQTYKSFVLTSCNSSTYPSICYHSLSPYASKIQSDPFKLCNVSLSLALKAALKTSSVVSDALRANYLTPTVTAVLRDCLHNVKDSLEELKTSLQEMEHLEQNDVADREFHVSTIKTEVSAAITDDATCSDGFDEENVDGGVREKIRKSVLNVERMTSNALYFINNFVTYY